MDLGAEPPWIKVCSVPPPPPEVTPTRVNPSINSNFSLQYKKINQYSRKHSKLFKTMTAVVMDERNSNTKIVRMKIGSPIAMLKRKQHIH